MRKDEFPIVDKLVKDSINEVLDKIRDEIDDLQNTYMADGDYNEGIRFGAMQAYLIIDKYRKEQE